MYQETPAPPRRLARSRSAGSGAIADVIGPHPFVGWQQAFDPLLTPGARNHWKTHDFSELSDAVIDLALEYVATLPDPQCSDRTHLPALGAKRREDGVRGVGAGAQNPHS